MNYSNEQLETAIGKLSRQYGSELQRDLLPSAWTEFELRKAPQKIKFDSKTVVIHFKDNNNNLSIFKEDINNKNKDKKIVSDILYIADNIFVTEYVEGVPLNEIFLQKNIQELADLQKIFNRHTGKTDIQPWVEKFENAERYLQNKQLISQEYGSFIQHRFTQYGLTHGDYDTKNIISTNNGLVIIDIEEVMYAPLAFDLARPLSRVCKTLTERTEYLTTYCNGNAIISEEELAVGKLAFLLIQAHNRDKWGYDKEATHSLKQFMEELHKVKK